jgi:hypothetical protein
MILWILIFVAAFVFSLYMVTKPRHMSGMSLRRFNFDIAKSKERLDLQDKY